MNQPEKYIYMTEDGAMTEAMLIKPIAEFNAVLQRRSNTIGEDYDQAEVVFLESLVNRSPELQKRWARGLPKASETPLARI